MTLTIEVTPEQAERVQVLRRAGVDVDRALRETIERLPERTAGETHLAELEADGAIGIWQDRPEDSIELARQFREMSEKRGQAV